MKIYIPDWTDNFNRPHTIPPLYPFLNKELNNEELVKQYGDWILQWKIVTSIEQSDVVVLLYEVGYYYKYKKLQELIAINNEAIKAGKTTICWIKGDEGITPPLKNFHLYRLGGYKSKNKGNQFAVPVFIEDPLPKYFKDQLSFQPKTAKPVVGFCGQGKAGLLKAGIDILRGLKKRVDHFAGRHYYDLEVLLSSTYRRNQILDALEASQKVSSNFIRHTRYRAGMKTKESKEESSRQFFKNIQESQYILCYRGAGNFSVRLFETLASGRIPVIVLSDNNLPFESEINWQMFPLVPADKCRNTANIISNFHDALSPEAFVALQQQARALYEEYLSYKGFMKHFTKRYTPISEEKPVAAISINQ
nr:exostosin family protein [Aridibaculum aurantiacum]